MCLLDHAGDENAATRYSILVFNSKISYYNLATFQFKIEKT